MTDTSDAALAAGWNPADGPPPFEHAAPPPIDAALGNNGLPPKPADADALFHEDGTRIDRPA